ARSQLRGGVFWDQPLGSTLKLSVRGSAFRGSPGDDSRLEVGSAFYYVRRRYGFRGGDLESQVEWTPEALRERPLRLVAGASVFYDDELLPSRIGVAKAASNQLRPGDVIDAVSVYQDRKLFLNTGAYVHGMWNLLADRLG